MVRLDFEHIVRLEPLPREQSITYLSAPRAAVIATVPDNVEKLPIHDPRVGGPDTT